MAGNPFDRTIINPRERPISSDINQAQSQLDYAMREIVRRLMSPRTSATSFAGANPSGFIGDGFQVRAKSPAAMQVNLAAGLGFVTDVASTPAAVDAVSGLDDLSVLKPLVLLSDVTIDVPAAPGADSRIDLIEVKYSRIVGNPLSRDVLTVATGKFNPALVNKTLQFLLAQSDVSINGAGAINYKTGTADPSPTAPSVTAGYVAIAHVLVATGDTEIPNAQISDHRTLLYANGAGQASAKFTIANALTVPTSFSIIGPAGVPIYVVQDSATLGTVDLYLMGNNAAFAGISARCPFNTMNVAIVGAAVVDEFNSPTSEVGSARCANQDLDPPGTAYTRYSIVFKKQKTTANYGFDQDPGTTIPTVVNLTMFG